MSAEFTGERVIPGQVDVDLWNEHIARYLFAARLASGRAVLDIGCGTGYGAAELGRFARSCTGIDPAPDALAYAQAHYGRPNMRWVQANASNVPFPDGCFDLVVSFEVIEHLADWPRLLSEARRMLAGGGLFVVSTPNRTFYAESRKASGPNPFHQHEFDYPEFANALRDVFPEVSLWVQNHSEGILFRSLQRASSADVRWGSTDATAANSSFFVAVCSLSPQTATPHFVYLPSAANVLRERALHIQRLEAELALKEKWLSETQSQRDQLASLLKVKDAELEERNEWGARIDAELSVAGARVQELQQELASEQDGAKIVVAQYEAKVHELDHEVHARTEWALETEKRYSEELHARTAELVKCNELLQASESLVEERTEWAQSLDRERETLAAAVNAVASSRWIKLGRTMGLGPEIPKR